MSVRHEEVYTHTHTHTHKGLSGNLPVSECSAVEGNVCKRGGVVSSVIEVLGE